MRPRWMIMLGLVLLLSGVVYVTLRSVNSDPTGGILDRYPHGTTRLSTDGQFEDRVVVRAEVHGVAPGTRRKVAADLRKVGWKVLEQNWETFFGDVGNPGYAIISQDGDVLWLSLSRPRTGSEQFFRRLKSLLHLS